MKHFEYLLIFFSIPILKFQEVAMLKVRLIKVNKKKG